MFWRVHFLINALLISCSCSCLSTYCFVSCTSVLLYLAVIFVFTGAAHADEEHWVSIERDGREVGCLLRWGADAVLNIGGAIHREEFGSGRGTPEDKRNNTFWCTTQTYCIKHKVRVSEQIFVTYKLGRMQASHKLIFRNRWWTKVVAAVMIKFSLYSLLPLRQQSKKLCTEILLVLL